MRLTRQPVGLLINYGGDSLQGERYAYDDTTNTCYLLDRNMEQIPIEDDEDDEENYNDPYADVRIGE